MDLPIQDSSARRAIRGPLVVGLLAALLAGCGTEPATPRPEDGPSPAGPDAGVTLEKMKIKSGDGEPRFEIKPKDDGAKLVDGAENELARYNASPGKLKIKDPDDVVLGYIVGADGKFKVEDASQQTELFKLQRQDDGDWKLEDAADKLIYKIKRRDYGYEIEDDAENSLYKIKVKGEKTSLRNAADETAFYTNDPASPLGIACLGFDAIEDVRVRVALLVSVTNDH